MSDLSDLDMSDALIGWEQPVKLKTRTETTIDFEPVVTVNSPGHSGGGAKCEQRESDAG